MTVTEKVYSVLSGDAGVTALVPASRIKPYGNQQGLTLPYIVHGGSMEGTTRTHDAGLAKLRQWNYKISCFAANNSGAEALANAVIAVLGSYAQGGINTLLTHQLLMPFEADVKVQQIVLEFELWATL